MNLQDSLIQGIKMQLITEKGNVKLDISVNCLRSGIIMSSKTDRDIDRVIVLKRKECQAVIDMLTAEMAKLNPWC